MSKHDTAQARGTKTLSVSAPSYGADRALAVPGTGTPGLLKCHANREQSSWVSWSPIEALRNPITFDQSERSFGCALQPLPFTLKH